jgi:hypothetical protein
MSSQYIFDRDFRFRKDKTSVWTIVRKILLFFLTTLSLAILYYVIFALVFSTDEERSLIQENRMYEKVFPEMNVKEELLSDVVDGLVIKDDMVYEEIFHTSAPDMDPGSSLDFLMGIDSAGDDDIVKHSASRLKIMERAVGAVEDNFRDIFRLVASEDMVMPPMSNPMNGFSFAQTGASVGDRINPFYKVQIRHDGLDMIAPAGEPVYASADGKVSNIIRSRKGLGNVVVIEHDGGYVTRYAHLADIEVRKGRKIRKGDRIGYVGVSGNSFAPHLHYEVLRDTLVLDPVNFMFASVTPEDYVNMLILSASTGQSMD